MKHISLGILAHVDAGKTTLSESMLYLCGNIRKLGRVDNRDTFLDTETIEKERGITIFSKQAKLVIDDTDVTLLDTPGHVDFSAEMERTLQIMDYAVLVISATQKVQSHTKTLWKLLERYEIPVFIFVNKMDRPDTDKNEILEDLHRELGNNVVDFGILEDDRERFFENIALCDEEILETYVNQQSLTAQQIGGFITQRRIYPCYFGSALKLTAVDSLMKGISVYTQEPDWGEEFGAKVYKIGRDSNGMRLTYLKVTGGVLRVKETVRTGDGSSEKVNQIRIYSGVKYDMVSEAPAGCVCAVTGLEKTYAGQCLGDGTQEFEPVLEPVLSYELILPKDCDAMECFGKLKILSEENPELNIAWNDINKSVTVRLMGEVQTEVLKRQIMDRFGIAVGFGMGHILYKETVATKAEGVGHYEPLRHYAEVHLLLEPLERGSGIVIDVQCSEDVLDKNWQRLIVTHLEEKVHKGVLTGAPITDIKLTLVAGRAHLKHTEGGDFREATYRAVRNGLMQAESVLLEPYYAVRLQLPMKSLGRAMTDMKQRSGYFKPAQIVGETAVLEGIAPVSCMYDYAREVAAYTGGMGSLACTFNGYGKCHNTEEVINNAGYDPLADTDNPASSVFCAHGAGFIVEWDKVKDYMHVESTYQSPDNGSTVSGCIKRVNAVSSIISQEEIDAIFASTFYANRRDRQKGRKSWGKRTVDSNRSSSLPVRDTGRDFGKVPGRKKDKVADKYLLVDGYNCIFAWQELKELADVNIDGARSKLLDCLCNYQGIEQIEVIVVFDAYRVKGHDTEIMDYHNIHVVYTKEAQTADSYIEKFAYENSHKYNITVATSDGLEQIIIRGQGCKLLSARDLEKLIAHRTKESYGNYMENNTLEKNRPFQELLKDM